MKRGIGVLFSALALLGSAPSHSAASHVRIAGLSLLMTSGEAIHTLHARHIQIRRVFHASTVSDYLAEHRSIVPISGSPKGHLVQSIEAAYAGGSLLLFFIEDLPRRRGVSVLTNIAVNYPEDDTVIRRIVAGAGLPSLTDGRRPWTVAMWCFGFTCNDMNRTLENRYAGQIMLVHRGSGLGLQDPEAATHRQAELDRILALHRVRRVP